MEEDLEHLITKSVEELWGNDMNLLEDTIFYFSIEGVPQNKYGLSAALYATALKSGRRRTQQDIAGIVGVSAATVAKNYRKLLEVYKSGQAGI